MLRLLLRQFEPDSGRLLINAEPLCDMRLQALRMGLAWVPQEPFLFSASIAENIALGNPQASPAQIEQAARMAAVHDDIRRLPHGYATEVGERGVTLSGGQRQRVAIARALLQMSGQNAGQTAADEIGAQILLLDDALSAVDTGTETQILEQLRQLGQQRPECSAIIVSHRLSAVMDADQIVVLRQGVITEQGRHDELLELGGWYAAQWRYQQLEASIDAQ